MISVIILTKNEEIDLPACLQSLTWSDDLHVLDSGSTDNTLQVAKSFKVNLYHHPFESFGKQRNYALDHLELKYDWVIFLDADEISTEKFQRAIFHAIKTAKPHVAGFYLCCKMILNGRWLKHCDNFPKWQFRLLRKGKARFTDFGHGQKEGLIDGPIEYIKEPYLHFAFSKGWHHWLDRHNKYSTLEAVARYKNCPPIRSAFTKHASLRNQVIKSWLSRMPGWPLLRFLYTYCFNLGFLEGVSGLTYCLNISYYEFLIQIKMKELSRQENKSGS